jgi:hypothetical protein
VFTFTCAGRENSLRTKPIVPFGYVLFSRPKFADVPNKLSTHSDLIVPGRFLRIDKIDNPYSWIIYFPIVLTPVKFFLLDSTKKNESRGL